MVVSDAVITASYYSIPVALVHFVRRNRDLRFDWIFLMFGAFIFACGTTHLIAILNIWRPAYWFDAGIKLATALISLTTAVFLWPLLPKVSRFLAERKQAEADLDSANRRLTESLTLLRRRTRELDTLSHLGTLLQKCVNADELAAMAARAAGDLSIGAGGAVYLNEAGATHWRAAARWGDAEGECGDFDPEQCAVLKGEALACVSCAPAGERSPVTGRSICVPLRAKSETLGVLQFRGVPAPDDGHARMLMQTLAGRVALALSNLRLRENLLELSMRDPLTGLFNRRHLDSALPIQERRARANGTSLGVIAFDLDCFKELNDTYGHDAGDTALQEFAQILRDTSRADDIACRSGGEEFVVVLPGTTVEGALRRAERVREALAGSGLQHGTIRLPAITVSAGVAAYPDHGSNLAEVLRAADQALYRAKDSGRNRSVLAGAACADGLS
ncbi:GGDEF domain-containing protein [Sinimarinibacterium flocculans]|uniref:GGDEF domain-containing protein n=1 Tax=Sinimarinibacterium flocculans TaxID=985250 RepID=UPI0035145F43